VAGAALALSLSLATVGGGVGIVAGLPEPVLAARSSFEVVSENGIKYRLPPVMNTEDRCTFVSSAMGQANAARDKIQDFRGCDMRGKSAEGFDLSGLVGSEADFTKVVPWSESCCLPERTSSAFVVVLPQPRLLRVWGLHR
jgi:hypothetical protein